MVADKSALSVAGSESKTKAFHGSIQALKIRAAIALIFWRRDTGSPTDVAHVVLLSAVVYLTIRVLPIIDKTG